MTDPSRPRLAAAADALTTAVIHGLKVRWSTPTDEKIGTARLRHAIADALAPHVPERDDCKGQVRLAADLLQLAAQWRQAGASQYGGDESLAGLGASIWIRCAEDLVFLLARHAPEPTDGE